MPSQAKDNPGLFDRFADRVHTYVSKSWFFAACVLLVIGWFPTLFFMPVDSSQLIINTSTTIVTFLLVALLENTAKRGDDATQHKLNAVAKGLADLMEDLDIRNQAKELREAVGLEEKESS